MFFLRSKAILVVLLALVTTGCATAPDSTAVGVATDQTGPEPVDGSEVPEQNTGKTEGSHSDDPIEGFNRSMWDINYDYLDPYILRPVSLAYVNYTPSFVRTGISNFFSNLDEPASALSNLLMGNGHTALNHFNRFWMNTTFGLFGLFDFAGAVGVPKEDGRSFSDAVGHHGVGNGAYVMLPGVGPTTVRNTTDVVDQMYFPLSYLNVWGTVSKWVFQGMESRAALVSQEPMLEASPDPYIFTREVYLQREDFKAELEAEAIDEQQEDYLDEYLEDEL
ncbi:MlaA family lipoprotein [Vibrio sp. HA2012]|uniref:MlaA family lipoprotein n=1 Tax=Vibrio sp. HA2012 TaxID=1971595 RepID=UPI001E4837F1|nr:MlaA family lipoprotein [Vibrio sp. HA2012]